jgi:hypothetical protein
VKFRLAAAAGALGVTATAGLVSAGSAAATVSGGGCGSAVYVAGLLAQVCVTYPGGGSGGTGIVPAVRTTGPDHSTVGLCVEVVSSTGAVVSGPTCRTADAYAAAVTGAAHSVPPGQYHAVAWFTSPTHDGIGESPVVTVS